MGKKDKKKNKKDPEKKAAIQAKKEAKADKAARKRLNKEAKARVGDGGGGEEAASSQDIDALLETYRRQDEDLSTPIVEEVVGPDGMRAFPSPPRGNFTLTLCPGGEMVMFGGEYYDGVENLVFDELYRWDPDAKPDEGDCVEQDGDDMAVDNAASSKAATEIFGQWKRVASPAPRPPARCAHSACVYNQALYIFGGELATSDQYHHYKDLWRFDLKANVWEECRPRGGSAPAPRSGHRALVWRHYMIIFGGFYEALRETRWYNDLHVYDFQTGAWKEMVYSKLATTPPARSAFNFALCPATDIAYVQGGYSKLKNPAPGSKAEGRIHTDCWSINLRGIVQGKVPTWERVSRKGEFPSQRSGTSCVAYKNQMLVYGGVQDEEGDHHRISSVFYDDLFALDMERRRWFGLRLKKSQGGARRRRKRDDADVRGEAAEADQSSSSDEEEAEAAKEGEAKSKGWDLDKLRHNMFAFIDGEGNIVYEKIEPDEDDEVDEGYQADTSERLSDHKKAANLLEAMAIDEGKETAEQGEDEERMEDDASAAEKANLGQPILASKPLPPGAIGASEVMAVSKEGVPEAVSRETPLPRINAAAVVRGKSTLYIYGGLLEVGDREVTLDDCWSIDLHKRDKWKQVWPGTMHKQVWRGAESDNESYVSTDRGADYDGVEDESDEEMHEEDIMNIDEEGDEAAAAAAKAARKAAKKEEKKKKRKGIRDEIAALKAQLNLDDADRTPHPNEAMADFYSRTTDYWNEKAGEAVGVAAADRGESLSAKELKREGFNMARERYKELKPVLDRLNELDVQQREAEEERKSKKEEKKGHNSKDKKERRNR